MAAKPKTSARSASATPAAKPASVASPKAPLTLDEQLHRIEALGKRVDAYVLFMCQLGTHSGTSAEAKERAVTAFYKQMVVIESQLAHIHDDLRLE